jgi:monovalent cation:proton antiporter-2 (CPA2) family protein
VRAAAAAGDAEPAAAAAEPAEPSLDCKFVTPADLETHPQLRMLHDALRRAGAAVEEATAARIAREEEASAVATRAVEAEKALEAASAAAEAGAAELEAARSRAVRLAAAAAAVEARLADDAGATLASRDFYEEIAAAAAEAGEGDSPGVEGEQSLEALLASLRAQQRAASGAAAAAETAAAAARGAVAAAAAAYAAADGAAAAAMAGAEDAARVEMDCVAINDDMQAALCKAVDDLDFMDAAEQDRDVAFVSRDGASAEADAAAERALAAAAGALEKKDKKRGGDELAFKLPPAAPPGAVARAAAFLREHRAALALGALALAAATALAAYTGALAAAGAQLSAATAAAGRLWAVAAELVARVPLPHIHESEQGLLATIWLLLASVLTVPLVCKLPGGSPVLGFLAGGALVGPYALGLIQDVESIRHLAELGVVFLLFNIGLELSFDRLASMGKFVFGMGTAQVVLTLGAVAAAGLALTGGAVGGPGAIILGGGLALSSTAVGMQVLQDRGETASRHGRAAFSVLLLQDLAVVVLLMLIPLLAPGPDGQAAGLGALAGAVGAASLKAVVCMGGIVVAGRRVLAPLYRRVADTRNAELFAALTLLVVLGTSLVTQVAGLSLALGAFLAGLLLAETEFHLQVESDIAPYKGLLMGLFFMSVGMEISVQMLAARFATVVSAIALLLVGKVALMAAVGRAFGLSLVQSARAGLLLAPGGEFAFVLLGEAMARGILGAALVKEVYLVVALSMALTPYLAEAGAQLARRLERKDMKALAASSAETAGLSNHVIIAGFGRTGKLLAQLLGEQMIPYVALDLSAARVQEGRALDLPVYFGDAGSPAVLHSVGAGRARCAIVTLDTPGSSYRSVYSMHKNFPAVKTFATAQDAPAGLMLERAGATAVVPEVLEPSLQLAAAVLAELAVPEDDVAEVLRGFRKAHLAEFQLLAAAGGTSLGAGA